MGFQGAAVMRKRIGLFAGLLCACCLVACGLAPQTSAGQASGWCDRKLSMTPWEFVEYSRALSEGRQPTLALAVLDEYRRRFPYDLGTGLAESTCYEQLGRPDESAAATFIDLLYQTSVGLLSEAALQKKPAAPFAKDAGTRVQSAKSGAWYRGCH